MAVDTLEAWGLTMELWQVCASGRTFATALVCGRIRIRISLKGQIRIRIRIKVKGRIRFRIGM
jgi:hypothetical protein